MSPLLRVLGIGFVSHVADELEQNSASEMERELRLSYISHAGAKSGEVSRRREKRFSNKKVGMLIEMVSYKQKSSQNKRLLISMYPQHQLRSVCSTLHHIS